MASRGRIDPGHASPLPTGGTDPGAVGHGVQEAECVLEICKLAAAMLRSQGVAIDMTRTGVPGPTVQARSDHLKRPGADCVISIHANAATDSSANGYEIFVSAHNSKSRLLGELISDEYPGWVRGIGPRKPPVKTRLTGSGEDYYYVVRHPTSVGIPAVLVEVGFVTNPSDASVLASFWSRFAIAYAISRGILRWLGVDSNQRLADLERELASANLDLADARTRPHQISILAAERGGE